MTHLICEDLTVVTFGSGPACDVPGMVFADNGARVLKVERPGGDRLRAAMPSAFLVWNRGKESVTLDLETVEGRRQARELAAAVDVVIDALGPAATERFDLAPDDLCR